MNGRTYEQVDRHLRPTLLGRLGGIDLKQNNKLSYHKTTKAPHNVLK